MTMLHSLREALPFLIVIMAVTSILYVLAERYIVVDHLNRRVKAIVSERARIRNRERNSLRRGEGQSRSVTILSALVHQAKLAVWLLDEATEKKLVRAGFRSSTNRTLFLMARLGGMIGSAVLLTLYAMMNESYELLAGLPLAIWIGFRLSAFSLEKMAAKRDQEMSDYASDVIDLLTVCVESGMSVELALQRVADEMLAQSEIVGEEFAITAAELSYVPKRSDAFSNMMARTGSKPVQDLCISLIQADSFGTSIAGTLRVQSAEARKLRRLEAERRALSIPPKLSVVMVFFFLPIIFIVMLYPTISKMMNMKTGL
jgi:tight adherence protein C